MAGDVVHVGISRDRLAWMRMMQKLSLLILDSRGLVYVTKCLNRRAIVLIFG